MNPRKSTASKQLRGSLNPSRERERKANAQAATPKTPASEMRAPPGLTETQRRLYRRTVRSAPWLTPADISALVLWCKALDAVMAASDLHAVMRQAAMVSTLGRQLGLTPAGRRALGIDAEAEAEAAQPGDPWTELRVMRGGRS
jgi:phage terminase small subunit